MHPTTVMLATGRARNLPPLDPTPDEARDWLTRELSKQVYESAKPTWFDLLAEQFWKWVQSLFGQGPEGSFFGAWAQLVIVIVIVGLIVAAFFIFGMPRLRRRIAGQAAGSLFGEDESRSSIELRAAADLAARASDWNTAVIERYRAIAKMLSERVIVAVTPGMTAQTLAQETGIEFPEHTGSLRRAAALFDGARYLSQKLSRSDYDAVLNLDRALTSSSPLRVTVGTRGSNR